MANPKELAPLAGKLLLVASGGRAIDKVIQSSPPDKVVPNVVVTVGGLIVASCVVSAAAEKLINKEKEQ